MKDITFRDSFSPTGATDSVTYNSGLLFRSFLVKIRIPADRDVSIHLWGRRAVV